MLNETQLSQVRKLYADPDWVLVREMFNDYIEPLIDIRNIDYRDNSQSVKGEIKSKVALYDIVTKFFRDVDIFVDKGEIKKGSNSME